MCVSKRGWWMMGGAPNARRSRRRDAPNAASASGSTSVSSRER